MSEQSESAPDSGGTNGVREAVRAALDSLDFSPDSEFAHLRDSDAVREEQVAAVLAALGIRETCWRCGHAAGYRNHDRQTAVSLDEWHRYWPTLVVHLAKRET